MSLTPDQLKKIEENRLAAIKRRLEKQNSTVLQPSNSVLVQNQFSRTVNNGTPNTSPQIVNNCDAIKSNSAETTKNSIQTFYNNSNKISNSGSNIQSNRLSGLNNKTNSAGNSVVVSADIQNVLCSKYVTGLCHLISENSFAIDVQYHLQLINLLRTLPGKMFDGATKKWSFPISQYKDVMKKINELKPEVTISPLPTFIMKAFVSKNEPSTSYEYIDISCISAELRDHLYPFQVLGIQFAVSKNGCCLIADDMGLGKTIQALGVADYYGYNWPLLIVCPSSMRYQWEEEVRKYIPNIPLHRIFVMKSSKDYIQEDLVKVLIVSYDLLGKKSDFLKKLKFGVIIMDECHSLKSSKTQRTKAALLVVKSIRRRILLSGTPALSRPSELYNQLVAIDPSTFSSFKEFGMRYCGGKKTHFGWDFSGSSNMEELRILLESKYMIRRLKKDVIKQLPSKVRQVVVLDCDEIKSQTQSMKAYADNLKKASLKGMERRGQLLSYFAETGQHKLKAVCEYVTKLLEDGKKFLCFAHHKGVLDGICEAVYKSKNEYIRIDGKVNTEDRKLFCDQFQYEDKYRVAVLSIKAANTGLTLTAAQLVVFAELFWNPGELIQAEDRVHRIGQQDSVLVQYLLAKGTADDYLWPLIQDKLNVLGKAGLSKDNFINSDVTSISNKTSRKQLEITDFFADDDDVALNEESLVELMDNNEDSANKRMKLM